MGALDCALDCARAEAASPAVRLNRPRNIASDATPVNNK
jgi:hypothetical protein